jgi:hypothetical protein
MFHLGFRVAAEAGVVRMKCEVLEVVELGEQ